jgi:hypothetical protein
LKTSSGKTALSGGSLMDMNSDNTLVTAAALARALGLSDSRIVGLEAEGLPFIETQAGHRFDLTAAVKWYVSRNVESGQRTGGGCWWRSVVAIDIARVRKLEIGVKLPNWNSPANSARS